MATRALRPALLAAALLLAACTDQPTPDQAAAAGQPAAEKIQLPQPSGPHAIGVIDFELVDESRDETFAPGTARRIPVRAWYPAAAVSGSPRPYAKPVEMEHQIRASATGSSLPEEVIVAFDVPTHAFEGAPVKALGTVPTVIFSHGLFSSLQRNTAQMEHLASHGYLVLSISHPYSAVATVHENGDVIKADPDLVARSMAVWTDQDYMSAYVSKDPAVLLEAQLRNNETSDIAQLFHSWQQDFIHVADRLESGNLPARAQALLPLVDMQRLGAYGMSFGASGPAAAFKDPRFKAAVDLDGGMFDSTLLDVESHFPILVLHGDQSLMLPDQTVLPWSAFLFEKFATVGTRENVFRLEVPGAAHIAFTDMSLLPESLRQAHPEVDAMLGSIDGQRMTRIMNDFTLAFFDQYLSGQGPGLDSTFRAQFPEVSEVDVSFVRDWALTNPKPGFMSYTHVFIMNRLLAADAAVKAAAAELDRAYSMVYELSNGPKGETVWWDMRFDPEHGVSFSLQEPESPADLTYKGDYATYIRFIKAMAGGKQAEEPVTTEGDPGMLETVGATFAASQKAATVRAEFPEVFVSEAMTLPDGRTLSWTEYGKPEGLPAFYLHGAGSSHFEGAVFHAEAKAAGVRLIATDRPGVAGSSLSPGQETVDYASDIAALADHLGITRFVVAGVSNGGMFTMAVAHALPNRVIGAVPINSTTPLYGDAEAYEVSPPETRAAYEGMKSENIAQMVDTLLAGTPEGHAGFGAGIPASTEPEIAALFDRIREPVTREAFLHEINLGSRAWNFDHLDVQVPVIMFSGIEDAGFPYAKVWAAKLPHGTLKTFPGGHIAFIAPAARRDIMEAVAALGSESE